MQRDSGSRQRRAELRVAVTDAAGRPVTGTGLERWLPGAAPVRARGGVVVALVSDRTMRRLNREFRAIDTVTDVLSFPASDPAPPAAPRQRRRVSRDPSRPLGADAWLGDIVIARDVAARQARRLGHSPAAELRILALHGLLHLLGYDHGADGGRMRRVEERLRRRAGLPAGLIARTPGLAQGR